MVDLKNNLKNLLIENEVVKFGNFTLSSGKQSEYYVDIKKAITLPEILDTISLIISEKIENKNIDKIAGPALGAVPIATAVSLKSKKPLLMIRKAKKEYGTSKQIEGILNSGDNVIVVEDVTTTGNSLLDSIKVIENNEGVVKGAFVIVDRDEGAIETFKSKGIKLEPILSVKEFLDHD